MVKTLQEFQYLDEHGMDQGQNGASLSSPRDDRYLTFGIGDPQCAKRRRKSRGCSSTRNGCATLAGSARTSRGAVTASRQSEIGSLGDLKQYRQQSRGELRAAPCGDRVLTRTGVRRGIDSDLEAAIAASELTAAAESKRNTHNLGEGSALEEALRQSREEDEMRRRELVSQPEVSLFDDYQPYGAITL